jgi:uncharacterized protein YoxC
MPGSLDTTNTMLAIIAAVAVLQGLVLLGLGFAGWKIYRLATDTIREIDEKRVKPLMAKVDGVLDKANGLTDRVHQITDRVHQITDRVQHRVERVEAAFDHTVNRVSDTTTGVKTSVGDSVHRVSDAVTSIRSLIVNALTTEKPGPNGRRHEGQGGF